VDEVMCATNLEDHDIPTNTGINLTLTIISTYYLERIEASTWPFINFIADNELFLPEIVCTTNMEEHDIPTNSGIDFKYYVELYTI
jgi:hypothetical protein